MISFSFFIVTVVVVVERQIDDPRKRKPDISKAKRVLGWEPKVETEDGLDLTIKYFQKEIERLGEIDIVGPLARRLKDYTDGKRETVAVVEKEDVKEVEEGGKN